MYSIVRMYQGDSKSQIIKRGLTLEEAQAHCRNPETSSQTAITPEAVKRGWLKGPWFDGYQSE